MERKYVNENRYKKTSRTANRKRTVKKKDNLQNRSKSKKNKSNVKKKNKLTVRVFKFLFCALILVAIGIVARTITRKEDEPFIPVFFNNNEIKENTGSINIAVYDNVNIGVNNSVITELEQYIYPMLLRINNSYEIIYEVISNVSKISNKEYILTLNTDETITAVDVKDTIERIIKEKNKYYYKVENVDKVEIKSENEVRITLKNDDEYFVYNLNIPLYKLDDKYGIYKVANSSNNSRLNLVRKDTANKEYIKNINVIKLQSEEEAIEKYKQGSIDAFFSSSSNSIKMLGKYEYDIKSYNNGEAIFLMFNQNSKMATNKYMRQIIAYSINRDGILLDVGNAKGKVIDLPYIYDEEKYKYDVYAADNIILSNGYKKQNLYYLKSGQKLSFTIIVNKDDEEKVNIANKIKNDLLKAGIEIFVDKLSEKELNARMSKGNYDMVLASVYMNENPNINHLRNNMILSQEVLEEMNNLKNSSDISNLPVSIAKIKTMLSDDIGIYGIYAKQTYVIYKKGIDMFKNINYINIFGEYFENIGN